MLEVKGAHNTAKVFTENLDNATLGQITAFCDQPWAEGLKMRIMPDCHAGAGCVIGTTLTIKDKICPNLVGVDIGCGMETVNIGPEKIDFNKLDKAIKENVPSGFHTRKTPHRFAEDIKIGELTCAKNIILEKGVLSIGSLGGGNHFIEVARADDGEDFYLIIHSGSRHVGLQVANWHQKLAGETCADDSPYQLAWLDGQLFADYIHDMKIMQEYADINRKAIADSILKAMKWKNRDSFSTIHNYVDTENMILRKGAVSAQAGERLLIPFNMADGSAICEGLGNPDWNFSAPHGAGRLYSRTQARESLTLTDFKEAMTGVYSTSIGRGTIDESPMAYKPKEEILQQIGPTVIIRTMLKPVYNYKVAGK